MVHVFVCVLSGGVGVVYTCSISGGDCRLAALCCQLCLQPPAHPSSGHHGSHAAGPPFLYRYIPPHRTAWFASWRTTASCTWSGMITSWCHFYVDFPAVVGEETEESRAAAELYTAVSQHTERYAWSYYSRGDEKNCFFWMAFYISGLG